MDKQKIKWYETNLDEYLFNTVYNPDSLTEFVPKEKWFKMNPCRGARKGLTDYDMSLNKDNILGEILKNAYGEIELCRIVVDNHTHRFNRRSVACGGALYPNNVYVVINNSKKARIYQYIPTVNILRLIYDNVEGLGEDNRLYFVYTNYYWRNWPKYKYFGYRLMQVDTGYAIGNLSLVLSSKNINYSFRIESDTNKGMSKILRLDNKFEAIEGVIETTDMNLINSVKSLVESKHQFELIEDWDTEPIPLYNILETNLLEENYSFSQLVQMDGKINGIESNNRISPGGGLMISRKSIKQNTFMAIIEVLDRVKRVFDMVSDNIEIYMFINKVEGLEKGNYRVIGNEIELLAKTDSKKEEYVDYLLRKKNFNLLETPVLFFIGAKRNKVLNRSVNDFKITNIKAGFVSQLITYVMCNSDFWTHPILGYDVEIAEKLFDQKDVCFLNLIPVSGIKPLDRESVGY